MGGRQPSSSGDTEIIYSQVSFLNLYLSYVSLDKSCFIIYFFCPRMLLFQIKFHRKKKKLIWGIFSLKSIVQRLRAELSFLTQCRVLVCSRCSTHLANQSDIFSMSEDGPQAAFVNLGGHLHETLTLYQARNLKLVGTPSTEYSWFPGYAWTILECRTCHNHIGWKFTAAKNSLKPVKFFGFSGKSIIPTIRTTETGVPADGGIRTDLADLNSEESGVVVI